MAYISQTLVVYPKGSSEPEIYFGPISKKQFKRICKRHKLKRKFLIKSVREFKAWVHTIAIDVRIIRELQKK